MRGLLAAALVSAALVAGYAVAGDGEREPTPARDPCTLRGESTGGAVTGTLERVGLTALAASACELGVSRERLLLSLAGEARIDVDDARRTEAFRDGLRRAIDEEERAGRLPAAQAFVLRQAVGVLPIEGILEQLFG